MTQEPIAKAAAFMRPLDQAGNVSEDELPAVDGHHAKLRLQRCERVIGDLRLRGADGSKKRRLAGIRQTDDAGIGDKLEPQFDGAFFSGLAAIGAARRAVGGGLKMRVAEPAISAMRQHGALAGCRQVGEKRLTIFLVNLRTDRDLEYGVSSIGAVPILAHAAAAVLGKEMLLIPVVDQRIEAG